MKFTHNFPIRLLAIMSVVLTAFPACFDLDTGNKDVSISNANVPSSFDFSTQQEVELEFSTQNALGETAANVYLEIYHSKSEIPAYKGVTNAEGLLNARFSLPTQVEELTVLPRIEGAFTPMLVSVGASKKTIKVSSEGLVAAALSKKSRSTCNIAPGEFRTQTQGGWGTGASGNNPGKYRDEHFAAAFPNGLTVGSSKTLHFTSSKAIEDFLPQGGKAETLSKSMVNPTQKVSVLAGQIVALTLSVRFDEYDATFGASETLLGQLQIAEGTFAGWTVYELLAAANIALGECRSPHSISDLNDAVSKVNESFVDGTEAGTFLVCPTEEPEEDKDDDDVPDDDDDYPDDKKKAFDNIVDGTLVWEDLWPSKGDFDFNDLVTDYTYNLITNADNKVVEMEATFEVRAIGASFHNGLALTFDIAPSLIESIEGQHVDGEYVQLAANGTEEGQDKAVVFIFENAFDILPHPGSGHRFVNTYPDEPYFEAQTTNTIKIVFSRPVEQSELGILPFNPFLIQNLARNMEIHLPDEANTLLANTSVFGTEDDTSAPASGRYYRTVVNLPWALHLPANFEYPVEKTDIGLAYPKMKEWAESGGVLYKDWYEDLPGYRDAAYIYSHP